MANSNKKVTGFKLAGSGEKYGFRMVPNESVPWEIRGADGTSFGKVHYDAYKAIQEGTIDKYKPKNDEEKKVIEAYRTTPTIELSKPGGGVIGKISYDGYQAINKITLNSYTPQSDEEKNTIELFKKYPLYTLKGSDGTEYSGLSYDAYEAAKNGKLDSYKPKSDANTGLNEHSILSNIYLDSVYGSEMDAVAADREAGGVFGRYGIDPATFDRDALKKWGEEHHVYFGVIAGGSSDMQVIPEYDKMGFMGIGAKTKASQQELDDANALLTFVENKERAADSQKDKGAFISAVQGLSSGLTLGIAPALADHKAKTDYEAAGLPSDWYVSPSQANAKTVDEHKFANIVGEIGGSVVTFAGAEKLVTSGLMKIPKYATLASEAAKGVNTAVKTKRLIDTVVTVGSVTAVSSGVQQDWKNNPWYRSVGNIVIDTTVASAGAYLGGKLSGKIAERLVPALAKTKLSPAAVKALSSSAGALAFAGTTTGASEMKNALYCAATGTEYKPDIEAIATNLTVLTIYAGLKSYAGEKWGAASSTAPKAEEKFKYFTEEDMKSPEALKKKMRQYTKSHHPDLYQSKGADAVAEATKVFSEINAEYDRAKVRLASNIITDLKNSQPDKTSPESSKTAETTVTNAVELLNEIYSPEGNIPSPAVPGVNNPVATTAPTAPVVEPLPVVSTVSVGDTFKDTKLGNTITVTYRDDNNTRVKISNGQSVEYKKLTNEQADILATKEQYEKIGGLDTETDVEPAVATSEPAERGVRTVAYTNDNQKIELQFKAVSADDLVVSNNIDGSVNPAYPQELQPRDRSRISSQNQIRQMAANLNPARLAESTSVSEGAPIVGADNVVESGNGRTLAIKLAYENGTADAYKEYVVDNAERFGIDSSSIPENPVLVRERLTEVDRVEFTRKANESSISSLSATEQATVDAENLTNDILGLLVPNEGGIINTPDNKGFIASVVSNVFRSEDLNNVVNAEGGLSARGLERITNAIFHKAYGDASLSARLSESLDNDMKNATNVLLNIAPKVAVVKNGIAQGLLYDFDFSSDIAESVRLLEKCKSEHKSVVDYSAQATFYEKESDVVLAMAHIFETKNRGAKQATEFYNTLLDTVIEMGNPNQMSFEVANIYQSKEDILNAAVRKYNSENESARTVKIPESLLRPDSAEGRNDDGRGVYEVPQSDTSERSESGNAVGVQQDVRPGEERRADASDEQLRPETESAERPSEIKAPKRAKNENISEAENTESAVDSAPETGAPAPAATAEKREIALTKIGDAFYSAFNDDAAELADKLGLKVIDTTRYGEPVKMVAFPMRYLDSYANKLGDGYSLIVTDTPDASKESVDDVRTGVLEKENTDTDGGRKSESVQGLEETGNAGRKSGGDGRRSPVADESPVSESETDAPSEESVSGRADDDRVGERDDSAGNDRGDSNLDNISDDTVKETAPAVKPKNYSMTKDVAEYIDNKSPSKADNLEAIRVLHELENTGKKPTKAQLEALAKYKGWGGLSGAFSSWQLKELEAVMTEEEIKAARATVGDAYYTPTYVIDAVYKALNRLGFEGGNVLEPSMGIGNFFSKMPKKVMDASKLFGVEIDGVSGRIASFLHPDAQITIDGYQNAAYKDGAFDLIVGNVPFGDIKLNYQGKKYLIHDFFFRKSLDKLADGGVMVLVTSKGTMDKADYSLRAELALQADLVAAYRLPASVFDKSAGASVATDIIIMQKKEGGSSNGVSFKNLGEIDGIAINEYFVAHPENIIGELALQRNQFGKYVSTVKATGDVGAMLTKAMSKLPKGLLNGVSTTGTIDVTEFTGATQRYAENGKNVEFVDATTGEVKTITGKKATVAKDYIKLRDIYNKLINASMDGESSSVIENLRKELKSVYAEFKDRHGHVTKHKSTLSDDVDFVKVSGLEVYDTKTKSFIPSEVFEKDTLTRRKPTKADSALDALGISLGEVGKVDVKLITQLTGKTESAVLSELADKIILTPDGTYELNEVYLSGNIREKLKQVEGKKGFEKNAEMLKAAMPEEVKAKDIAPQFGAPWITPRYIGEFLKETLNLHRVPDVSYDNTTGTWVVEQVWGDHTLMTKKYGTSYVDAMTVAEKALNMREIRVKNRDGVTLVGETRAAQQKVEDLRNAFEEWCFKDSERRNDLVRIFNEKFNSHKNMDFSALAEHLTFAGMSESFKLRDYQRRAVARTVFNGNTLLAHGVGTGKTVEMIASAMELKRLGVVKKNLMVVPNHKPGDFRNDILKTYPSAKVISLEKGAKPAERQKFFAQVASGDWDICIVPHSSFALLDVAPDTKRAFIQNQIDELEEVLTLSQLEKGKTLDGRFVRQLENQKKKLELKLEAVANAPKDKGMVFEELGIDSVFVDEAHNFKSLPFYTKLARVAGVSSSESSRAENMFMITDYVNRTGGRVNFATATPITNSMTEIYNMLRFLRPEILKEAGIGSFDAWASMFGSIVNEAEVDPTGRNMRMKERFSKFKNVPQMVEQFRRMADILKTGDVIQELPEVERIDVINETNDIQEEFLDVLNDMVAKIQSGGQKDATLNMLTVTKAGQMAAIDLRMVVDFFEGKYSLEDLNLPGNRISKAVERIYNEYVDSNDIKGTQFVFCDEGVRDNPEGRYRLNVYNDLINKLVAAGIPRNEIAVAQDFDDKTELSGKVNTGEIRVLIGSTMVMGEGMNAQERAVALHHLTVPYRPSDIEQREGRIIRFGNINKNVRIYRYIQERSYDSYQWQMQERKANFINQALSNGNAAELEEMSDFVLTAREAKAIASGNPLLLEKMDVEDKLNKVKLARNRFNSDKLDMQDRLKTLPLRVEALHKEASELKADADTVAKNKTDDFKIKLYGKSFTERKAAAEHLELVLAKVPKNGEFVKVGEYLGLDVLYATSVQHGSEFALKGIASHKVDAGDSALGNITRLTNLANKLADEATKREGVAKHFESELKTLESEIKSEFPQAKELAELQAKLDEINEKIGAKDEVDMSTVVVDDSDGDSGEKISGYRDATQVQNQRKTNAERDAYYLELAKNPEQNRAELEEMVYEEAKKAGFPTKVYHGTTGFGFTKLDVSKSDDGISFFATDSLDLAQTYSGVLNETSIKKGNKGSVANQQRYEGLVDNFINKVNEIAGKEVLTKDNLPFDSYLEKVKKGKMDLQKLSNAMTNYTIELIEGIEEDTRVTPENDRLIWELSNELETALYGLNGKSGNYGLYANTDNFLVVEGNGAKWSSIPFDKIPSKTTANTREITAWAKDNGYDGVLFKDIYDLGLHRNTQKQAANVYAFLKPQEQLTSADPVTYGALGGVIPLSKRFGGKKKDIRYSKTRVAETENVWKAEAENDATDDAYDGDVPSLSELMKDISDSFGVTVATGKVTDRRAKGIFKNRSEVIRTRTANDLPTAIHELGHYFDKKYNISKFENQPQAMDLVDKDFLAGYSAEEIPGEVAAEFVRRYFKNPKEVTRLCPSLTAEFLAKLSKEDAKAVKRIAPKVYAYLSAEAEETYGTTIVSAKEAKKLSRPDASEVVHEAYTKWIDGFHPVKQAVDFVEESTGAELTGNKNAYKLAINSLNGQNITNFVLTEGFRDLDGDLIEGAESLAESLKTVDLSDKTVRSTFDEYLKLRHSLEVIAKGKQAFANPHHEDPDTIKRRIASLEMQYPQFKDASEKVYAFERNVLSHFAVKSGLVTQETADFLNKEYPCYVPFYRFTGKGNGKGGKKSIANQGSPIMRMKGSGLDTLSPLENVVKNAERIITASIKHQAASVLTGYADKVDGFGSYIERVPPDQVKKTVDITALKEEFADKLQQVVNSSDDFFAVSELMDEVFGSEVSEYTPVVNESKRIIAVQKGGARQYYQVHDEALFKAITELSPKQMSGLAGTLLKGMRLSNAVITQYNLLFGLTNPLRDARTAYKLGDIDNPAEFAKAYAHAIHSILANDETYQQFRAMGGGHSSQLSAELQAISKTLADVYMKDQGLARRLAHAVIHHPISTLTGASALSFLSDFTESVPRFMVFQQVYEKTGDLQEAIYAADDITTNFKKQGSGTSAKFVNGAFRFNNAAMQGLDKTARTFKDASPKRRRKLAGKWILDATLIAIVLCFYNRDRDEEGWENLSSYKKNNFYNIAIGDGKFISLPKERENAVLNSLIERTVDKMMGEDDAFYDFGGYIASQLLPPMIPDSTDVVHSWGNNTIFGGLFDLSANKDFKGDPIETDYDKDLPSNERYNSSTTWLAYNLGQTKFAVDNDLSPKKIDHLLSSYLGFLGSVNKALLPKDKENRDITVGLRNRFVSDSAYSTDVLNIVYENRDLAERDFLYYGTVDKALEYEQNAMAADFISEMNRAIRALPADKQRDGRKYLLGKLNSWNYDYTESQKTMLETLGDTDGLTDNIIESGFMHTSELSWTVDKQKYAYQMTPQEYYDDYVKVYFDALEKARTQYGDGTVEGYEQAKIAAHEYMSEYKKTILKNKYLDKATLVEK